MQQPTTVEWVIKAVRAIEQDFDAPDDDFEAMIVMETKSEQLMIFPAGQLMNSETTKDLMAEVVLPGLIRKHKVSRVVAVLSAWCVQVGKEYDSDSSPRPSEHPDRYEVLLVTEMTAQGVGSDYWAYINRDPFLIEPPSLGEFELQPETATHEGRFVDPIVAALKEVEHDGSPA